MFASDQRLQLQLRQLALPGQTCLQLCTTTGPLHPKTTDHYQLAGHLRLQRLRPTHYCKGTTGRLLLPHYCATGDDYSHFYNMAHAALHPSFPLHALPSHPHEPNYNRPQMTHAAPEAHLRHYYSITECHTSTNNRDNYALITIAQPT